jgi:hypothetical protein
MAEFTAMRNNVLDRPIYGLPYVVTFPLLDADGDPVSPSSPDSEISKNGDTAADCTNEATEISGLTGVCYLSLTGTELTCDVAAIECSSTGAKTTILVLQPAKLVTVHSGTAADDGSGTGDIVLDSGASAIDDFYNGMIIAAVIDSVTEVRIIDDYVGSTKTASVTPDWNTAPDNNDTFTVYLPPNSPQIKQANVSHWNAFATVALPLVPTVAGRSLDVSAGGEAGVDWANVGSPTTTVGLSGTTVKTVTDVETDTQDIQSRLPAALTGDGNIKADTLRVGGTLQTARDIGASVLLSSGTGTGQLSISSGLLAWSPAWDAEVQSEVQDAIEVNHLDHLIAVADPGSVVANSSFLAKLVSKSATPAFSSYDNTTDSLEANRDNIGTAGAGLTAADDAVIAAISALNNLSASGLLTTALADAYAANGAAPTLQQALMAIHQHLMAFGISGTSRTVKKLNGSTTAFTETLDSSTAPTALARS